MIMRFVEDPPYIKNAKPGRIDGIGLGLLAVWLGALQIILDKGQEDDWFGATWIRWTAALLVISLRRFPRPRADARQAAGGPARLSTPKLPDRLHPDRNVWRRPLWADHLVAAVLSGAAGIHGLCCRLGGEPARHRRDHGHADHRHPDQQDRQPLADRRRIC